MITADGWLDWAARAPGPLDKCYTAVNRGIGYVPHSAVGFYGGWASRLFSGERRADGRYTAYAAASVHGWVAYDGSVTQHYPLSASCWASGSEYPNTNFIAFENEGGFDPEDELLTPAQVQANARIIRELAAWRGWPEIRRPHDDGDTAARLYEHHECVRWGSAPTACPSRRIPWDSILAALGEGTSPAPAPQPAPGRTVIVHLETGVDAVMDIDEYAQGVLPYEMGSGWPVEALKAQAVAAKSYALAAGAVFSDTRSQVYGPLRYPDTDAAVEAVRGVYLAKEGQIVMPFYFGHCNGRTRSPAQAGWNAASNRPYLKGVECACGNTAYFGHGIGMCQRGAQTMALQGSSFDEILRHFYTGIEILGLDSGSGPILTPANATVYVVVEGDTLLSIAVRFGLDWGAIYTPNRHLISDPNVLPVGCQLVIPRPATEEGQPDVYVVQPGDTLFALSRRWGCGVDDIAAANGLGSETLIRVGQRLRKP
ncbi:MAG: SpoIID/LytB domain-containing protein [Dehalococcoidia bacterium]|nr:SpoIID/LytB domain-containing protein [Dehalococcoidia bacterium]